MGSVPVVTALEVSRAAHHSDRAVLRKIKLRNLNDPRVTSEVQFELFRPPRLYPPAAVRILSHPATSSLVASFWVMYME